ncbi:MAG: 50S ribosomal protein L20 [Candidatus Liptonbacteria bacterium CG11_big_fil_rev_8_21_14_0_20_35_14]|uniref:Large ribosomal subunit protein bL20 n=1 Tax=Candidatus Liptonbacteria bacterium CG11_big_fil_rev_8_21_14_0_20_35_14 TaxID=1974634 RepID=A0A2H0NA90_9BACT|nr:MAG: 50S ribosomal protein L20 [Candidatus Liptonbacteria bacterium CG11_big_fil_rev_8_21_14_0_20_35_14]
MSRVKRGTISNKTRKNILKQTKGFKWGRKNKERLAKEALLHSMSHAFRGRKEKKRVNRRLWQTKINGAVRELGMTYSTFIYALKKAEIKIDRKILAQIAEVNPKVFEKVVEKVK